MKHIQRLLATILVMGILSSGCVYAAENDEEASSATDIVQEKLSDIAWIDDVFKYDLEQSEVEEVQNATEVFQHEKAVQIAMQLGILLKDAQGKFNEKALLTQGELERAVRVIATGNRDEALSENKKKVTTADAAGYMVQAVGYDAFAKKYTNDTPLYSVAQELKLFKGLNATPTQALTRGEFAVLVYNTLHTEILKQTVFGEQERYEVDNGTTLLSERFNAVFVQGVLTAVTGANLYTQFAPSANEVEIDRASFTLLNYEDFSKLLGHKVSGYALYNEDTNQYLLLGLYAAANDDALEINLCDVISVTDSKLTYEKDGKEKTVSISDVRHVLNNGTAETSLNLKDLPENAAGTLVLGKSGSAKGYDLAVVQAYNTFVVQNVSTLSDRILLDHGATIHGMSYIDFSEKSERQMSIILNDQIISAQDLLFGDVISVVQSKDGNYIHVVVSRNKISGTVSAMTDAGIVVDGTEYKYSNELTTMYDTAGNSMIAPSAGDEVTLSLSIFNQIADVTRGDNSVYGIVTGIKKSNDISETVSLQVFTQSEDWKTLTLAKKLNFDGKNGTTSTEAYKVFTNNLDTLLYEPIRYRADENDVVRFLDTILDTDAESLDDSAMRKNYVWSGEVDWRYGFNLPPSSYAVMNRTLMFQLPLDVEDHEAYQVISNTHMAIGTEAVISIYAANEFDCAAVATYVSQRPVSEFNGARSFVLEKVSKVMDTQEEQRIQLSGYRQAGVSPGVGSWSEASFLLSADYIKENPSAEFKPGDIFFYILNEKEEILDVELLFRDGALYGDHGAYGKIKGLDLSAEHVYGKVTRISQADHLIYIDLADGSGHFVFMPCGVQVWDSARGKCIQGTMADITIGDTVFCTGSGVRHGAVTILQ